jgi:hypothetical protein
MLGTWINFAAIIVGGGLGVFLGGRLSDRVKNTVIAGMGLFVIALGVQMFLKTTNSIIPLGGLLIGGLLGEWWKVEEGFSNLGAWLERRILPQKVEGGQEKFVRGFLTASILFLCRSYCHSRIHPGRVIWRDTNVGRQIHSGWFYRHVIRIHHGGGCVFFGITGSHIPGSHNSAGCTAQTTGIRNDVK